MLWCLKGLPLSEIRRSKTAPDWRLSHSRTPSFASANSLSAAAMVSRLWHFQIAWHMQVHWHFPDLALPPCNSPAAWPSLITPHSTAVSASPPSHCLRLCLKFVITRFAIAVDSDLSEYQNQCDPSASSPLMNAPHLLHSDFLQPWAASGIVPSDVAWSSPQWCSTQNVIPQCLPPGLWVAVATAITGNWHHWSNWGIFSNSWRCLFTRKVVILGSTIGLIRRYSWNVRSWGVYKALKKCLITMMNDVRKCIFKNSSPSALEYYYKIVLVNQPCSRTHRRCHNYVCNVQVAGTPKTNKSMTFIYLFWHNGYISA